MRRFFNILVFVFFVVVSTTAKGQFYSIRTNTLLWLTATPNLGFSVEMNRKLTFDIDVMINPIKLPQLSLQGVASQQGVRHWFVEANVGAFIGGHLTEAVYDVGNKDNLYKGFLVGAGFSAGYSWLVGKRWNVAVELGASILYMQDSRYPQDVPFTQDEVIVNSQRWVVAPTKCAVSLVYMF